MSERKVDPGFTSTRMRGRWWLVVVLAIAGGVVSYLTSERAEPVYQATTTLLVGDVTDEHNVSRSDIKTSIAIAATYGSLIRSRDVLDPVIDDLGLSTRFTELRDNVHVDLGMNETPLIAVAVAARSPEEASAIATAVGERAVDLGPSVDPLTEAQRADTRASEFRTLEREIELVERRVARLEDAVVDATDPRKRARLRSVYEQHADLLMEMHASYAARLLPTGQPSPHSVRLLQPTLTSRSSLRPNVRVNTMLGVAIGGLTGLGIAYGLALRTDRGVGGSRTHPVRRMADPWVMELAEPQQEDRLVIARPPRVRPPGHRGGRSGRHGTRGRRRSRD